MASSKPTPRANRYDNVASLVYREIDRTTWRAGELKNMSRTGALWRAALPLPLNSAPVEFVVALPRQHEGRERLVRCVGRVVRVDSDAGQVAATIDDYEFVGSPASRELRAAPSRLVTG